MIKKVLFLGILLIGNHALKAVVATGDTVGAPTTFQFSVGSSIYDAANQQLWTLSGQDTSSLSAHIQSYGIAYTPFVSVDGTLNPKLTAYPYLSSQAVITSTDGEGHFAITPEYVENPLLGKYFTAVSFLGSYLTAVAVDPRYVYLIQSVFFADGAGYGTTNPQGSSIINVLDLGETQQAKFLAGSGMGALFIAQAEGTFGTDASSILFASTVTNYALINGQNTSCVTMLAQAEESISTETPQIRAGGIDVLVMGSSITMYPSSTTAMQMYVGLDLTASVDAQAVALITAKAQAATTSTPAAMTFGQVMPDVVAQTGVATPVSVGSLDRVVVADITTTQTSTGLSYIITSYSNGEDQQSIYAMPMVTMATDGLNNGKIAAFDSIVQTFRIVGTTYRVQGFGSVIDDVEEININGAAEVVARIQVGAGPVPLVAGQTIEQLTAQGDAVYITIHEPFGVGTTPGMFKSQALFDAQGRIMSWSPWQRVAGTDDQMLFAIKNRYTDATMYVSGANSDTIEQTTWNNNAGLTGLVSSVSTALPLVYGGVQGVIPVSNQTPDLSDFALVIGTGNQTVVICQTGSLDEDDNLVINEEQPSVTINSQLDLNIGSVVTATFGHDVGTSNNWFFMGGDSGLAVLSDDETGVTFNGPLTSLDQLVDFGMSCKTLGNFKYVKKLISSGGFLYILTTSGVYRIALVASKFRLDDPTDLNIQTVVLSSTIDKYAACLDMLVDNNLMLLGTTNGLYSLNLSSLPATAVVIEIPGGLSAVSRLNTISNQANFNQDFFDSSNLYVLTLNYAFEQARLNRFTITDGVVQPIQDQLLPGQNGPLLIFNFMNSNIFIDGSLGFATSYQIGNQPAAIKYLQYTLQAGKSSTQVLLQAHTTNISLAPVLNSVGIAGIARDYASGCLMLGADFGLLTDSSSN